MRVMVIVKATTDSEAGGPPDTAMLEAMGRFNEELADAGLLVTGAGLKPTSHARRVRFDGAAREVVEGPFGPPEELVAGYWIWNVENIDEAVAWVKRCPNPMPGPSVIEIRPFYELSDFEESLTPEIVERDERLRRQVGEG